MPGKTRSRRARTVRVPVALPPRIVDAWIEVPIVRDEIEFRRRVILVKAAIALKRAGLSQNAAAKELNVPGSALSVWLASFSARGEESLRPKPWNGGKKPANGRQSRGNAFLAIKIK